MPILDATINSRGKPFIVSNATQTLREALKGLKESGLASNRTYLVVETGTSGAVQYSVELFLRVISIARLMDYESLDTFLGALPLSQASRIVPADTQERVSDVLRWVRSNSRSRVLVTRDGIVVGLFATADLAVFGFLDRFSLSHLHGDWIDLTQDPRAIYESKAEKPTCPGCTTRNHFHYEVTALVCPHCGYKVNLA